MKFKFLLFLFLALPLYNSWADSLIVYETQNKDKTIISELEYKSSEGYREKYDKDFIVSAPSCLTYEYTYTDPANRTVISALKKEKEILITGTFNGNSINKTLALGNLKWFQSWGLAAKYAAAEKLDSYIFLSIRQDTMELMEFEIKLQKSETITVNGEQILTQKYHIAPAGLLAMLIGVDYWVRASDGVTMRLKFGNSETLLVSEKLL